MAQGLRILSKRAAICGCGVDAEETVLLRMPLDPIEAAIKNPSSVLNECAVEPMQTESERRVVTEMVARHSCPVPAVSRAVAAGWS